MLEEADTAAAAQGTAPGEDIDTIVARLREKKPVSVTSAARATELQDMMQGAPRARGIDISKAGKELAKSVGLLGNLYRAFEMPLSKVAQLMGELPFTKGLQSDLVAADMKQSAEAWLALAATGSIVFFFMITLTLAALGAIFMDPVFLTTSPLFGAAGFLFFAFFMLRWPAFRANERSVSIDHELPFALRQLATQVKAGVSFNRAIASIGEGNYPNLTPEFKRVLADLDRGASTEEALTGLTDRVRSRGLHRAIAQILRALRTGGRVSEVIGNIAEDVSFETRMRIRDFTETLNLVSIVYLIVAVVAPVGLTILSAIIQLPLLAGAIPPEYIPYSFMGLVTSMVILLFITIRLEPGA